MKAFTTTGQVNVNSRDSDSFTPLSYAARSGDEAIVKLLLETGQVDVDDKA